MRNEEEKRETEQMRECERIEKRRIRFEGEF